jgi:hypothetical protein
MTSELKAWLNHTVYPRLSHDLAFGSLPNFTKAEHSETRYADCPRCHRAKALFMPADRPVGNCDHCHVTITWWSFLKFDRTDEEAIRIIAELARVEPLSKPPDDLSKDFGLFRA